MQRCQAMFRDLFIQFRFEQPQRCFWLKILLQNRVMTDLSNFNNEINTVSANNIKTLIKSNYISLRSVYRINPYDPHENSGTCWQTAFIVELK